MILSYNNKLGQSFHIFDGFNYYWYHKNHTNITSNSSFQFISYDEMSIDRHITILEYK